MRVQVAPTGLYSRAMTRVAAALTEHAPNHVEIVEENADLVVSHVIGYHQPPETPEAVIQYCYRSAGEGPWVDRWRAAKLTWSYYDLPKLVGQNGFPFYYAPLGVDAVFTEAFEESFRHVDVMTSGYVTGPGAEAIEEVTIAARSLGLTHRHLGPDKVEGSVLDYPSILGVSDEQLAEQYRRTLWVSGLRHVEGFELPVIEGLCCGARPIVFDRPEMRRWFDGVAVFVPECSGKELIERLRAILGKPPQPVSEFERASIRARFDWRTIASGFWDRVGRL